MQLRLESRMIISVYFKKIVVIMLAPSKRCGVSVESFVSQNEFFFGILDFLDSPLQNHVGAYPYKIVELIFVVHFPEIRMLLSSKRVLRLCQCNCLRSLGFRCKKSGVIAQ